MNVFFDTNVLLDVLAKREPFYHDSARLWTLAEHGKISGLVSVLSFSNIYYIVRRLRNRLAADRAMQLLRNTFHPVSCDAQVLHQAMDAGMADFEDAIQYFSALHASAEYLVSRNPGHFPRADLPVLVPTEFLAAHFD